MMVRLKQAMELIYTMREKKAKRAREKCMAKKMTLYIPSIPSSEGMIGIENGEKGAHNEGPIISKSVYIEIHATKKMQATYKRK